MKTAGASKVSF